MKSTSEVKKKENGNKPNEIRNRRRDRSFMEMRGEKNWERGSEEAEE